MVHLHCTAGVPHAQHFTNQTQRHTYTYHCITKICGKNEKEKESEKQKTFC